MSIEALRSRYSEEDQRLSRITTCWSVVFQAHQGKGTAVTTAQQELFLRYRGAVYRYLLAALRDPDAAEEAAQEFAHSLVRGDFQCADPNRGRFRDYIKAVVFHLAVNHQRRRHKEARWQSLPKDLAAPDSALPDADRQFLDAWREELLERTWEALASEQQQTGRPFYAALRLRAEQPALTSDQLAQRLGAQLGKEVTAPGLRQTLHRARQRYADLLLDELCRSLQTSSVELLEQEAKDLGLLPYCQAALRRRSDGGKA
jgi:RNA polymerase sigma-70 factor (ECF subfamily)